MDNETSSPQREKPRLNSDSQYWLNTWTNQSHWPTFRHFAWFLALATKQTSLSTRRLVWVFWLNLNQPLLETLANLVSISQACSHFLEVLIFFWFVGAANSGWSDWQPMALKRPSWECWQDGWGTEKAHWTEVPCCLRLILMQVCVRVTVNLWLLLQPMSVAPKFISHVHTNNHAHTGHQAMNPFTRVKQKVLRLYNLESQSTKPVLQKSCW